MFQNSSIRGFGEELGWVGRRDVMGWEGRRGTGLVAVVYCEPHSTSLGDS
jgi:hypothetical protein